jgi:hypothetical protein
MVRAHRGDIHRGDIYRRREEWKNLKRREGYNLNNREQNTKSETGTPLRSNVHRRLAETEARV